MNFKFYYWGPLLYQTKLNNVDINKIKIICKKNKNKDYRKKLAGHINEEFSINNNIFLEIVKPYLNEYIKTYEHWYKRNLKYINVCSAWVNFMKNGEFNPPHIHSNGNFSCIIYLQIPEKLKKENKKYIGTEKNAGPGAVHFMYGEHNENNLTNVGFLPEEGDFFIFPCNLRHFVYPFKSKVERISVSANFILD